MAAGVLGIAGTVLGVLLGFGGQVLLARRQESRRLDDARRQIYAAFLTEAQRALNTLSEGALNRISGAVEKGAYKARFFADQERLLATISGMELVSTPAVLSNAKKFLAEQWALSTAEANADPIDCRSVEDDVAKAMLKDVMAKL